MPITIEGQQNRHLLTKRLHIDCELVSKRQLNEVSSVKGIYCKILAAIYSTLKLTRKVDTYVSDNRLELLNCYR